MIPNWVTLIIESSESAPIQCICAQSSFRNENVNYSKLKNENDIEIKITAGKTNENENYYKRKNENEKSGGKRPYCNLVPTCRGTALRT